MHPLGGWVKLHWLNHIQLSTILREREGGKEGKKVEREEGRENRKRGEGKAKGGKGEREKEEERRRVR